MVSFTSAPDYRCKLRKTDPAISAILIKFLKALLSDVISVHLKVPHIIGYLDLLYNQKIGLMDSEDSVIDPNFMWRKTDEEGKYDLVT